MNSTRCGAIKTTADLHHEGDAWSRCRDTPSLSGLGHFRPSLTRRLRTFISPFGVQRASQRHCPHAAATSLKKLILDRINRAAPGRPLHHLAEEATEPR